MWDENTSVLAESCIAEVLGKYLQNSLRELLVAAVVPQTG